MNDIIFINVLKIGTCLATTLAPFFALMPTDALTASQKWGVGIIFLLVGYIFYSLWKDAIAKLEAEKDQRIEEGKERIQELLQIIHHMKDGYDKERDVLVHNQEIELQKAKNEKK